MAKKIMQGEDYSSAGHYAIGIANPRDKDWTRHRFILAFGAYGWTRVMVWANGIEDALEEAAEWLKDHAPGIFTEPEICEACEGDGCDKQPEICEACEGDGCDECDEHGLDGSACEECDGTGYDTTDLTYTESGYIASWEWTIAAEDPTREEILAMMGRNVHTARKSA